MIGREFRFHHGGKGAALAVRIKSGSKNNRIKKVLKDGTVVVNLKGNKKDSNQELLEFLSRELQVEKDRMEIIAGQTGRNKLISILQIQPHDIQRIILDKIV